MACCNINYSISYETEVTDSFKSIFARAQRDAVSRENIPSTTGWFPIFADFAGQDAYYCQQLSLPQITGYTLFDPLNCQDSDFTDKEINEPNATNLNSEYCDQWASENNSSAQVGQMRKADGTRATKTTQGGLYDVMTHQADVYHGIPYLMPQYASGFMDNKFTGKFPLTMNPALGWSNVVVSTPQDGNNKRYSDWHIAPRMGEVAYDPVSSQYANERDHRMAMKKAMIAHKTSGNFILFNVGDPFESDAASWSGKYYDYGEILEPILTDQSTNEKITLKGSWDLKLPTPEEFIGPYGFDAKTYNNVFVGDKKRVSYWKWDIINCTAAWVLKTDEEIKLEVGAESDKLDYITYIPSGDCFIARIDPIEPENFANEGQLNNYGEKRCPSGVKFIDDGKVYTIPHNSLAVYVSCNIYPAFYEAFNKLKTSLDYTSEFIPESEGGQVGDAGLYNLIQQAMFVATHPLIDKITIDLHKNNPQTTDRAIPHIYGAYLNPQYSYMNAYDKNYASFGNLNTCKTWTDIARTISNKYGSYYDGEVNIDAASFTNYNNSHIGVDIVYDFTAKGESVRTRGRQNTEYKSMTPWYPDFQISAGGLTLKVADERSIIQRTNVVNNGPEEGCELGDWKAFSNLTLSSLGDSRVKTLYSTYLQSGLYEMDSYYIRNVNRDGGSIRGYCDECDEYSTYENYGGSENCAETGTLQDPIFPFCDCDENPNPEVYPELPCVPISDNTLRMNRMYPIIVDTNSFPINMAFHKEKGVYYRARNLEEIGFLKGGGIPSWQGMSVKIKSFDTRIARTKAWIVDVYQLQTNDRNTKSCERFPVLENCEQPKIVWDSQYPIVKDIENFTYENTTAFTPSQSTKYSPKLIRYGGYNEEKLAEMFPLYYQKLAGIGDEITGNLVSSKVYRIDPDSPFGCESSDYMQHENYVQSFVTVDLKNHNDPYCDLFLTASETIDITGPRYFISFDPDTGREVPILNKDFKRFTTSIFPTEEEPIDAKVPNRVDNPNLVWPGGGEFLARDDIKKKDTITLIYEQAFLNTLLTEAGAGENNELGITKNIYPPIENPGVQFEQIYFDDISYTWCDNREMWYDFGDQTSRVTLNFIKRPRPVKAKFVIFPPAPITLSDSVKFDFNQIKPAEEGLQDTYFRNQLPSNVLPKYTFNNDIAPRTEKNELGEDVPVELPQSISWKIPSSNTKQLAALFKTIHSFDSNRKIRIILQAEKTYWEVTSFPTKYYSHGKSWQGFPHFVKPVFEGRESNYLPGTVPFVQRIADPADSKWIVRPNTKYAADKAGLTEDSEYGYDPTWPLNLQLNNYRINTDENIVTFPGARMFFTMFPELNIYEGNPDLAKAGDYVRIGSFIYYKLQDGFPQGDEKFQDFYLIFNPFETYTWQKYSDLHIDFANTSYFGNVYNASFELPNIPFWFYREPFGDRSKLAKALATKITLKSTLQDGSGRRIFAASLVDGCVDYCQEGGITYLKIETEVKFANNLNKDWLEINDEKTPLASYHIYHPECVGSEKDRLLVNDKYSTKWADIEHFDQVLFDHWIDYNAAQSYYPPTRYPNSFYKMIVDNGNYINTQKNSLLSEAGPFRFMVHQKYSVDYDAGEPVASRRISGVHNYLPFMDVNDSSALQSANYLMSEPVDNFDGLVLPVDKDEDGVIRPDLEFILTIPAECRLERTWLPDIEGTNKGMISESLRVDVPRYWLSNIDMVERDRCDGDLSKIRPRPYSGKNYGTLGLVAIPQDVRPASIADDDQFPVETWRPEAYAIWNQYCNLNDEAGCITEECEMNVAGSTELRGLYTFANPNTIELKQIADRIDNVYITYDAGIMNGMNGYRPPVILRSLTGPVASENSKNNIQYSQDYPDDCRDKVVLPPLYQYPEWDTQVQNTFHHGCKDWIEATVSNPRARAVAEADIIAEEMVFRALYGETEYINRDSIDGRTKLTANEIINYVDPEITVTEMHNQILWDYDKGGSDIQKPKVEGRFTVNAPYADGESVVVKVNNKTISASITPASSSNFQGSTMNISFDGEIYSFPVRMTETKFSTMISVDERDPPPEVDEDSSLEQVQAGRVVEPRETIRDVRCMSRTLCDAEEELSTLLDDESWNPGGPWEPGTWRYRISNIVTTEMGGWNHMILQVPQPTIYPWYDLPNNCQTENDIFGPYTRRCKPYEYGYCNVDVTECPPCTGNQKESYLNLVGSAGKNFYTTIDGWNDNWVGTDNNVFDYEYKYCRNEFSLKGYWKRENYSFAPEQIYRSDLVIEYGGYLNQLEEALAECQECGDLCQCWCSEGKFGNFYPNNLLPISERVPSDWGWCDYQRIKCEEAEQPCAGCGCVPEDDEGNPIYIGFAGGTNNCWCRGGPGGGGDPEGCVPYGAFKPCYQRYCWPATQPGNQQSCLEVKNLAGQSIDSIYTWWDLAGFNPNCPTSDDCIDCGICGEAYKFQKCSPKGWCVSSHDQTTQSGPLYDGLNLVCNSPPNPITTSYGRWCKVGSYPDIRCGSAYVCHFAESCDSVDPQRVPDRLTENFVNDTKYDFISERKETRYNTYIKETTYGEGASQRICNSGQEFDGCPRRWFSISYTNNSITMSFNSGSINWRENDERPMANNDCIGPALSLSSVTLCLNNEFEEDPDVQVKFSNELGHITSYEQTTDCNCGDDIVVSVPEQKPVWATRTLEGKCYVSQWVEQYANESVITNIGNASAVCQSNQTMGVGVFGFLQGFNNDTCYNNAGGSSCPSDRRWYGVAEGYLRKPDCNDGDSCSAGRQSWEDEQRNYHILRLDQYGSANAEIPEENIIEGMVPGSMSELKFKTYSVEGGQVVRPISDQHGVEIGDMAISVVVAYYEYKYRARWDVNDVITQLNGENYFIPSAGNQDEDSFQSCYESRPFGPDEAESLEPRDAYWRHYYDLYSDDWRFGTYPPDGNWYFESNHLNYRCDGQRAPYPNWYKASVAPHRCFPRYGEYYGRYDTPPFNFIWTVPTISQDSCTKRRTCYYNDKQWPSTTNDPYLLADQGTFLHCQKYLGRNWVYDYVRGSPLG